MGLAYSYRLFFPRKALWSVLQGLEAHCERTLLPTLIVFPEHMLPIHLEATLKEDRLMRFDDVEFNFALSMAFPTEPVIREYKKHLLGEQYPLEGGKSHPKVEHVGVIYLTIHNYLKVNDPQKPLPDLVLFSFGTTGTRMSMLFSDSESIRNTFIHLLELYNGVCGIFNRELEGNLFWYKGQQLNRNLSNSFMTPDEIALEFGL